MASSEGRPGQRVAELEQQHNILQSISGRLLGQDTLASHLAVHVDRINSDLVSRVPAVHARCPDCALLTQPECCLQELEHQLKQGASEGTRQAAFLCPYTAQHQYGQRLQGTAFLLKLLVSGSSAEPVTGL